MVGSMQQLMILLRTSSEGCMRAVVSMPAARAGMPWAEQRYAAQPHAPAPGSATSAGALPGGSLLLQQQQQQLLHQAAEGLPGQTGQGFYTRDAYALGMQGLQHQQQQQQLLGLSAASPIGYYSRDASMLDAQLMAQVSAWQQGRDQLPPLPQLQQLQQALLRQQAGGNAQYLQQHARQSGSLGQVGQQPGSAGQQQLGSAEGLYSTGSAPAGISLAAASAYSNTLQQEALQQQAAAAGTGGLWQQPEQQQQAQALLLGQASGNALGYTGQPAQALQQAGYAGLSHAEFQQRLAMISAGGMGAAAGGLGLGGAAAAQPDQAALALLQQRMGAVGQQAQSGGQSGSWLDAFEQREKLRAAENAAGMPVSRLRVKPPHHLNASCVKGCWGSYICLPARLHAQLQMLRHSLSREAAPAPSSSRAGCQPLAA